MADVSKWWQRGEVEPGPIEKRILGGYEGTPGMVKTLQGYLQMSEPQFLASNPKRLYKKYQPGYGVIAHSYEQASQIRGERSQLFEQWKRAQGQADIGLASQAGRASILASLMGGRGDAGARRLVSPRTLVTGGLGVMDQPLPRRRTLLGG